MKNGLLGNDEEWAQAVADNEQRRAQQAEDAAALQNDLDHLDAMALQYLKPELLAERETTRISPQRRRDYSAFRAYARDHGWPHDAPQTLFAFLARDLSHPARVRRLHNSIQAVIRSTGLDDITNDPVIRALMRRLARNKTTPHQKKEEENNDGSF